MNIKLPVSAKLLARAEAYAKAHGTSLDQMIREYLEQLTEPEDGEAAAREFAVLATRHPGRSPEGFRFQRDATHHRE
jgi:hypothetical protein